MDRVALTQDFYQRRIDDVNTSDQQESKAQKVGWKSHDVQLLTFDAATDLAGINWQEISSVLDIGCGYGNLVEYLRGRMNYAGNYTGIDVMPEFIEAAGSSYGNDDRNHFITGDVLAESWQDGLCFDVVFCLGALTLNHDQPAPYGQQSLLYAEQLIATMLSLASVAVVLHFPSEDNMSAEQRKRNPDMAFYRCDHIERTLRQSAGTKLRSLAIAPYPDTSDVRTMARLLLKT